jgi:ABC-type multidrug transport system fused ATPase/permease subunit
MSDGLEKPKKLSQYPAYIWKKICGFFSRLFYIFALVWQSAPLVLITMMTLCLIDGLLPVVGAYISSHLLNGIQDLIEKKGMGLIQTDVFETMRPLVFLFTLNLVYLFLKKVMSKVSQMVTGIAGELVVNHIKLMIIGKAKSLDTRSFDDPEFYERLEEAEKLGDGRVLIESYLPGRRELECAYFESSAGVVITPPGEAVCNKEFYDFHEKYESGEVRLYSKSPLSDDISERLIEYTKILSRLFGLRHIGRVDFFLADGKKIYFNEVNPTPGLTESSLYLGMLGAAGVSSEEFVFSIERWLREAAV